MPLCVIWFKLHDYNQDKQFNFYQCIEFQMPQEIAASELQPLVLFGFCLFLKSSALFFQFHLQWGSVNYPTVHFTNLFTDIHTTRIFCRDLSWRSSGSLHALVDICARKSFGYCDIWWLKYGSHQYTWQLLDFWPPHWTNSCHPTESQQTFKDELHHASPKLSFMSASQLVNYISWTSKSWILISVIWVNGGRQNLFLYQ